MDKQGIIDYVLDTPTNTNPRILGHMLDEYADGGGVTSPFRTVAVEVTNEYGDFILQGSLYNSEQSATYPFDNVPDATTTIYNMVIDQFGMARFQKIDSSGPNMHITFEGDVEVLFGSYKITGPCSFHISKEFA